MNKILIITSCVLLFSSVVLAEETTTETCANGAGTVVTGAVSGYKYCMSNQTMNWWNANAWCDSMNKHLFNLDYCRCDDRTQNCSLKCPELTGVQDSDDLRAWTTTPFSITLSYFVRLSSGAAAAANSPYGDKVNGYSHRSLCK